MSNYEYQRTRGGLGWLPTFTSYGQTFRGPSCAGGGRVVCGRTAESTFMTNQGCTPTTVQTEAGGATRLCFTGEGPTTDANAGTVWCCPPGRPGTEAAPGAAITQPGASRADIRELQSWVNSIGCDAGTVDGKWGPNTARGVRCAEERGNATVIAAQFPWVATMRVTPTGSARPETFTFDPGNTVKTPEQVVAAGSPGGSRGSVSNSGSNQADIEVDRQQRQQRAGVLGSIPWWGWALIAAGGVGLLGVVGLVALGDDEEDDDLDYYDDRGSDW